MANPYNQLGREDDKVLYIYPLKYISLYSNSSDLILLITPGGEAAFWSVAPEPDGQLKYSC